MVIVDDFDWLVGILKINRFAINRHYKMNFNLNNRY